MLKDGVRRSMADAPRTKPARSTLLGNASVGQWPYAAVLSCIDSRAPVEQIFDAGIGDLFVCRVAGNTATPDLIASLEYATKYAGAKAIIVLGHTHCGAVKGAWAGLQDGHLTELLARIQVHVNVHPARHGSDLHMAMHMHMAHARMPACPHAHEPCTRNMIMHVRIHIHMNHAHARAPPARRGDDQGPPW